MDKVIDRNTLRQSIMNEIADLDRLRWQARDSCAPVTLDQQSVGRVSLMDAMQQRAMHIANDARRQQLHTALLARGFRKTCPQWGKGPLLTGYLKPLASCSAFIEDFNHISADDGPAWLTLLIIGHAVVPLMLFFGRSDVFPLWLVILILAVFTLIGFYFILPRAKGIFISLIWLTDANGQTEFYDSPDLKD